MFSSELKVLLKTKGIKGFPNIIDWGIAYIYGSVSYFIIQDELGLPLNDVDVSFLTLKNTI